MKRMKGRNDGGGRYLHRGWLPKIVGGLAVLALTVACDDTASEKAVTAPGRPQQTLSVPAAQTSQAESRDANPLTADPIAAFHRKNFADWVGQAHNKAMQDFLSRLNDRAKGPPTNFCGELLEFATDPARVPPGKGTPVIGRAAVLRVAAAVGVCAGKVSDEGATRLSLASATSSEITLSAAAVSLVDQIKSAQAAATTASGLATALTPILGQADQLPVAEERDVVYATASVAQSSFEYWTANLQPQADQVQTTYGGCLVQYSDQGVALNTCMGISGPPVLPTLYKMPTDADNFLFVLSTQSSCDSNLSKTNVVLWDVAGGLMGGLGGWLTGGAPGILTGALGGGLVASLGEGTYQMASWAWCKVRGGGGGGTPKKVEKT